MKNIHVLPTDKPSSYVTNYMEQNMQWQNIYITTDEEIKPNVYALINGVLCKTELLKSRIVSRQLVGGATMDICKSEYSKIILTTDQDLIKDGVQAIDDEFLQWFVNNPTCEEVYITNDYEQVNQDNPITRGSTNVFHKYKIIIPQEEPKQDYSGVHIRHCYQGEYEDGCKYGEDDCPAKPQEAAKESFKNSEYLYDFPKYELGFIKGAKWQAERMYSEEDMHKAYCAGSDFDMSCLKDEQYYMFKEWFEQFKKK
jgi:hypothetical protein